MNEKPMAFQWMEAAMESDLPAPARHVFMVIAKRYNIEKGAFPSFVCLAKDTGFCVRTVQDHVRTLVDLGWLTVHKESGRVNHYTPTLAGDALPPSRRCLGTQAGDAVDPSSSCLLMTNITTKSNEQEKDQEAPVLTDSSLTPDKGMTVVANAPTVLPLEVSKEDTEVLYVPEYFLASVEQGYLLDSLDFFETKAGEPVAPLSGEVKHPIMHLKEIQASLRSTVITNDGDEW